MNTLSIVLNTTKGDQHISVTEQDVLLRVFIRGIKYINCVSNYEIVNPQGTQLVNWIHPHIPSNVSSHEDVEKISRLYYIAFGNFQTPNQIMDLYKLFPANID